MISIKKAVVKLLLYDHVDRCDLANSNSIDLVQLLSCSRQDTE